MTASATAPPHVTVSALCAGMKELLEAEFTGVWVAGEISNFVRASSGHMYLSLKDAQAQIKCAFFRGFNLRLKFDPYDGLEVFARGRVTLYPPRGDVQFVVEELQPKGLGAAELALRQLKEKLLAKGYFDPRRKRPLPPFPRRVALVASPTGAAIRDMLELLSQRWPLADVIVRPSRVQGETAGAELAAALRLLNQVHASGELLLDAVILGRGGGSSEDLAAFDEEILADAIFQSAVPVISAVGHETDVSIADMVADLRAETPSAAVVALVPDRREMTADLLAWHARLTEAVSHKAALGRQRVQQIASRPAFRRPLDRVRDAEQKLDDLAARLRRAAKVRADRDAARVAAAAEQLAILSPLNVLGRGYSLTQTADGRLIRDAGSVRPGDVLVTRVAAGTITSRTESTTPAEGPAPHG